MFGDKPRLAREVRVLCGVCVDTVEPISVEISEGIEDLSNTRVCEMDPKDVAHHRATQKGRGSHDG